MILFFNKPKGLTSQKTVLKVKKTFKREKSRSYRHT